MALAPEAEAFVTLTDRILRCETRAALEAVVPDICALAGGIYRQDLASVWLRTWDYRVGPDVPVPEGLWPQ